VQIAVNQLDMFLLYLNRKVKVRKINELFE